MATGKYSEEIVNKICELIREDSYTVADLCKNVGISERIFYVWRKENADFAGALKDAQDAFINKNLVQCKKSLSKLINGYEYEEEKVIYADNGLGGPRIKEKTVTKKHVSPNLGAIIHYQTNRDPQNWKNKQSVEATVEINPFAELMKKVAERKEMENGDTKPCD
jgi:transposase-like protein